MHPPGQLHIGKPYSLARSVLRIEIVWYFI
jgi:hypothetical protein